jgi:ArsR family transcriptional regulator
LAPGGRLLIADFAPHDLEELRRLHAHKRLGFAGAQVREWLAGAGLTVIESRDLAPGRGAAGQKLTVSLWLAERREDDARKKSRVVRQSRQLERMRP